MIVINLIEADVSRILNCSIVLLRKRRVKRDGPAFRKFGKSVRYPVDELQQWVEQPELQYFTCHEI